jgi:hypothetical protein
MRITFLQKKSSEHRDAATSMNANELGDSGPATKFATETK